MNWKGLITLASHSDSVVCLITIEVNSELELQVKTNQLLHPEYKTVQKDEAKETYIQTNEITTAIKVQARM